jgi:hypothetical protein
MSGAIQPSTLFQLHHVLTSRIDDTGAVMLGLGDTKSEESADEEAVLLQASGIVSVPPVGAEALSLETSAGYITIASRDIRSGKIAGRMQPAETTVYAPGSQACTLYKLDGSVTQFTTHDNTDNGKSVYSMVAPTGFTRFMPHGKETFDERGFHVLHASGARIDLGAISGLPGPLSALGSYAGLSAKIVRIEGSIISLGTTAGSPEPVAKATTLYSLLTSLQAEHAAALNLFTAIAATPAAIGTVPAVNPAVIAAFTALNTAMGSTVALLAAAVLALPSAAVTVT